MEALVLNKPLNIEWPFIRMPTLIFIGFIVYVGFQAIFLSIQPHATRVEIGNLVFYFIFFICLLRIFSTRERMRSVSGLIAFLSATLIGFGVYQQAHHLKAIYGFWTTPGENTPFFSTFLNQNHYGFFLLLCLFFLVPTIAHTLETSSSKLREDHELIESIFYFLLIPLAMASTFFAEARAAFAGEVFGFVLFWIFSLSKERRKNALAMGLIVALAGGFFIYLFYTERLREAYQQLPNHFLSRMLIYQDVWRLFGERSIGGWGLGTFTWISPAYQSADLENSHWAHAWSEHLELLSETGIIGYSLFISAVGVLTLKSLKNCLQSRSHWVRLTGIASSTAILCLALLTFFDYYLRTPAIAMLAILHLAVLVRAARLYSAEPDDKPEGSPPSKNGILRACFLGAAMMIWLGLFLFAFHQWTTEKALAEITKEKFTVENADLLKKAVSISPDSPELWGRLGDIHYGRANQSGGEEFIAELEEAMNCYQKAIDLAPTWPNYYFGLGRVKVLANKPMEGILEMEKGIQQSPENRDLRLYTILSLLKLADHATDAKSKKLFELRAAQDWKQASALARPLTKTDFSYLRNSTSLSPQDKARLTALFQRMGEVEPRNTN